MSNTSGATNILEIKSVTVNSEPMQWRLGHELWLGAFPESLGFHFGPHTNSDLVTRLQYKLEGYDSAWHRGESEMMVRIRFFNESRKMLDQVAFSSRGDSSGWNGDLKTSSFTHRRESIHVPHGATRCMAVISSAGPPSAVGIFVVADLTISRIVTNGPPHILLRTILENFSSPQFDPKGWDRDGTRPDMAQVIQLGQDPKINALSILDDDPVGHAEWHTKTETLPVVVPGSCLVVEWNELFSIGVADMRSASYKKVPAGTYKFRVQELTVIGAPAGPEISLVIHVAEPWRKQTWFWALMTGLLVISSAAGSRYRTILKLRREMGRLKRQKEVEQERLRIARDIHDDLGARVTQISMLSGMAPHHSSFPTNARADFERISHMCRELVSALYETIWAVSPENDNLNALSSYLRQMVSQTCEFAQLRCRLHIPALPRDVRVSSPTRHAISMAAKEAVHNVVKHAKATEITIKLTYVDNILTVCIQDNGCGIPLEPARIGNGLVNIKQRLKSVDGSCVIESNPEKGTTVTLSLRINGEESGQAQKAFLNDNQ